MVNLNYKLLAILSCFVAINGYTSSTYSNNSFGSSFTAPKKTYISTPDFSEKDSAKEKKKTPTATQNQPIKKTVLRRELKTFDNKKVKAPRVRRISNRDILNKELKIARINGEVLYGGKKLSASDSIMFGDTMEVKKGKVTLEVPEYGSSLQLMSNTKAVLFKKKGQLELLKGSMYTTKDKGKSFKVMSKNSSVEMMKSTTLIFFKPLLTETEIIVFSGKVQMDNLADITDKNLIENGQWGGLGGRYGKNIGDILNLPKAFLNKYEKAINK